MKVRLFQIDREIVDRQYVGYFTAKDGKVVFFPSGHEEPLADEKFIQLFDEHYPAFLKGAEGMVMVSMYEPGRYLKHLEQRYHGQSWVEVTKGRGRRCPVCDSDKVVRIIYGLPQPPEEPDGHDDWKKKQILGGCCGPVLGAPKWGCTDCGNRF